MMEIIDKTISQCKFDSLIPILNVKSIPDSINYYVNILGFKQDWDQAFEDSTYCWMICLNIWSTNPPETLNLG